MKSTWYYVGAALFGVITGVRFLGLNGMNVVICGPHPYTHIIRDLQHDLITAIFGVIHLWLVYRWIIPKYRSEEPFGFMRTTTLLLLSLIALASVVKYIVMAVAVLR